MPLKPTDLGILGILLILISGMFRLIAFMVKKSYEKKCQAIDSCPLNINIEKTLMKISEIHSILISFKEKVKTQVETVSGKSERITKESMEVYGNLCKLIERVITETSKIPKNVLEENNGSSKDSK